MSGNYFSRLHWKLFFPLIGLLWLIIGITITYFVTHEKQRQKENLENRLMNVNTTVIDAYDRNVNLKETVDFIRLFTDNTTLAPLRITVYDKNGRMLADNAEATIPFNNGNGNMDSDYDAMSAPDGRPSVSEVVQDGRKIMVSSMKSADGNVYSFAALPYAEEVTDFLSIDPMVWIVVLVLGMVITVIAFFGVRAVCRNVYTLRDFARTASSDTLPDNADRWRFSNDELGDVSRDLLALYRDKIHAEREKIYHEQQIAMNVRHELNTPVGIIKGYLDTVLNDDSMPETMKMTFLRRAQQNADRLASLIKDVSMVMNLQDGGESIDVEPVDFQLLAGRIADDIVQGHISDNMKFVYDIPADCRVMVHESLLINALLNLVYNAARYSGGSKIELKWLRRSGGMHWFSFADNGSGVAPEHLERLFDLFYRVDNGRARRFGGSGLGLPLVQRIIVAMGGTIDVDNKEGGGLRFTFSLPTA